MTYLGLVKSIAKFWQSKANEYKSDQIEGFKHFALGEAGMVGNGRISCEAMVRGVDTGAVESGNDSTAKTLVVLVILGEVGCRYPKARGRVSTWLGPIAYIIVCLGDAPPDTKAQLERKMREAFRIDSVRCLCVDEKSSLKLIVEMLAVSFLQCGLSDGSLEQLLGLRLPAGLSDVEDSYGRKRQWISLQLIKIFTDPSYPASYASFRRQLEKVANNKFRIPQRNRSDEIEPQESEGLEVTTRRGRPRMGDSRDSLTISVAAQRYGIPRRTLYDQVAKGKIEARDGEIARSEYEKIEALVKKRQRWKSKEYLVQRLYEQQPADRLVEKDSIRRKIDRYLVKGFSISETARRLRQESSS